MEMCYWLSLQKLDFIFILFFFFFFKQKTAYEMQRGLVGSEMCIRDRYQRRVHGSLSNIVNYSSYFSIKSDSITERIEIQNPVLNSNRIFQYYMDLLERSVLSAKNEALMKNYIDLLYEFCKNEYFLESDKKNTGKNLIFIYEPLNSYMVNVDIQLIGFSKLSNIPTEALSKFLVVPVPKAVLTPGEARKKLIDIHMHPSITSKLSFIMFVGELIDQFVYFELLKKRQGQPKVLS
eukprot:TRINITY_DN15112_c0_g1_i1.p1 TRINITY_DN15112_c0_g1~~TRINITY_DN15112_c0_g1_i1.p1  ORF type:complete len:235 (+),score=43.39 TRINITY_DN15112_c0_g1_i1:66-770(+)